MSIIFAVDSSGKTAGACVVQKGHILFEETLNEGLTHSETLLPLVQRGLDATGLQAADVGLWGLAAGPGSFTGLRIGMALVKGLAFPSSALAAGVSTLEALAFGCGLEGTVIAALDARRQEVYWAAFSCGDGIERLSPDSAGKLDSMSEIIRSSQHPVYFVGDGAELCYTNYSCDPKVKRMPQKHPVSIVRGVALLAQQTQERGEAVPAGQLCPRYLRLSQAERERAARLAQQ